jgi:hypothetical protein
MRLIRRKGKESRKVYLAAAPDYFLGHSLSPIWAAYFFLKNRITEKMPEWK